MHTPRRGSYALLFGISVLALLAFGALAIDVSYIRLAQSKTQDVVDAASQGALIELRRSGDEDLARQAALDTIAQNNVVGAPAEALAIDFGLWEDDVFTQTNSDPNAVQVSGQRELPLMIAPLFGFDRVTLPRTAVSSVTALQVIVVMDITNSWDQADFNHAREGSLVVYDVVSELHGRDDRLGMSTFTNRFGIEQTPLLLVSEHLDNGERGIWENLERASKAGIHSPTHKKGCEVYGKSDLDEFGDSLRNNFTSPHNGCFPNMFREYSDESGTDHWTGLEMARRMFDGRPDVGTYKAVIFLTDGEPNGTAAGGIREDQGFEEDRWAFFKHDVGRGTDEVIRDTQELAAQLFADEGVHIWAVSFKAPAEWLEGVAQGDGYFVQTSNAADLVPIFTDIAESLPLAIVQ